MRLAESAGRSAAHVAQLVEHILGKDEVSGSIPLMGSRGSPVSDRVVRRIKCNDSRLKRKNKTRTSEVGGLSWLKRNSIEVDRT